MCVSPFIVVVLVLQMADLLLTGPVSHIKLDRVFHTVHVPKLQLLPLNTITMLQTKQSSRFSLISSHTVYH